MKRIKMTGLCLVGMCAALALSAVPALAASDEYKSQFVCTENLEHEPCNSAEKGRSFDPTAEAFSGSGDVWVVSEYETAYEFTPSGGVPVKEINKLGFDTYGAIAVNSNGDLFITNYEGKSVEEYNGSGTKIASITGGKTASGSFAPFGVAVNGSGDLYVADLEHGVVDEFAEPTGSGEPVPIKEFTVTGPEDVAVNGSGDLYAISGTVVDEFNPGGTLVKEFTGSDTSQGSFGDYISSIAVGPSGELYVNNGEAGVVDLYSAAGKYESQFDGTATPAGHFEYVALAVNASGEVYAGDGTHKVVDIFSPAEMLVEAPVNTALPTISGTAKEHKTLSTTNGTWENSPKSYAYQWEDCNASGEECSSIGGATQHEYTLTGGDVGHTLRVVVTATNTGGSTGAESAATTVVEAAGATEAIQTGEVYGEVPETTTLGSTCDSVYLGEFLPGVANDYSNTCALTVTSTGEASTLTASDESATHKGHLVQGSYFLAKALEAKATDKEGLGGAGSESLESLESPITLLSYATPVSADNVEVEFNQPIGPHDALHTGKYAKTVTLTLKQTTP